MAHWLEDTDRLINLFQQHAEKDLGPELPHNSELEAFFQSGNDYKLILGIAHDDGNANSDMFSTLETFTQNAIANSKQWSEGLLTEESFCKTDVTNNKTFSNITFTIL